MKPIWVLRGRAGSQEDTKGGVASVASALELATRKQVATSEGAAVSRKRCYVAKDQFMHSTSFKIA